MPTPPLPVNWHVHDKRTQMHCTCTTAAWHAHRPPAAGVPGTAGVVNAAPDVDNGHQIVYIAAMKTLTIRDFRTQPAAVRRDLAREPEVLLTANGRPYALVTPMTGENADEVARALRMARAQLALRALRRQAREAGTDGLGLAGIDAVIAKARAARRTANRRTGR